MATRHALEVGWGESRNPRSGSDVLLTLSMTRCQKSHFWVKKTDFLTDFEKILKIKNFKFFFPLLVVVAKVEVVVAVIIFKGGCFFMVCQKWSPRAQTSCTPPYLTRGFQIRCQFFERTSGTMRSA